MTNCPKCKYKCEESKVAVICPNCDYIHIKKFDWKGESIKCPNCKSNAKIYKNHGKGKTFVCDKCDTQGRYIDEQELHAKVIDKSTELGKKLSWLFDVPSKIFHHDDLNVFEERDECGKKHCPHCDVKKIIDVHNDEVIEFCDKHNIEIYVSNEYIEIMHKI